MKGSGWTIFVNKGFLVEWRNGRQVASIDLREKINQVFYYPTKPLEDRSSLIDVLMTGIKAGKITPYGNAV